MAEVAEKKNIFRKAGEFFKNLKAEMKKITWPTWDQTWKQTLVVVIISLLLSAFIRLFDVGAQLLINWMSKLGA